MPSTAAEWDEKHRLGGEDASPEPTGIMRELLPLLPMGRALDLACGIGRNALFLAEQGWQVTAVDWSGAGLEILEARARDKGIPTRRIAKLDAVRGVARAGIDLLHGDLEKIELPAVAFDLVICIRYLQRSLFPQISRALRPGGMVVYETYTQAQLDFAGGPKNPAFLLQQGELREAFPELRVVFYRELRAGQGIASLAAQRA